MERERDVDTNEFDPAYGRTDRRFFDVGASSLCPSNKSQGVENDVVRSHRIAANKVSTHGVE